VTDDQVLAVVDACGLWRVEGLLRLLGLSPPSSAQYMGCEHG
jgi:hypothetical protein